jgi:hypothetical protein
MNIEEVALELTNVIAKLGVGILATGVNFAKWSAMITPFLGKDLPAQFEEQLASLGNIANGMDDFTQNVITRNQDVLASWGRVTEEAREFGTVGPAAYVATAEEAKKAADAMKKAQQVVADTKRDLESIQKALMGDDRASARAFADQEGKLSDLRKALTTETDPTRRAELQTQLAKEAAALDKARPMFAGAMAPVLDEARTRATGTDFERSLQDIRERKVERLTNDLPQILLNINFNEAVAGDDGIQRIIRETVEKINRSSELKSFAGA